MICPLAQKNPQDQKAIPTRTNIARVESLDLPSFVLWRMFCSSPFPRSDRGPLSYVASAQLPRPGRSKSSKVRLTPTFTTPMHSSRSMERASLLWPALSKSSVTSVPPWSSKNSIPPLCTAQFDTTDQVRDILRVLVLKLSNIIYLALDDEKEVISQVVTTDIRP